MRYNHFSMLPEKAFQPVGKRMTLEGGDTPTPSPTNTTVTNTNIPDYAQPYVENMLNAAQAQIYKPDMTGFNAYTPYSNNPQDYVAGFSPMQQQAQSGAANLKVPGQFGTATAGTLGAMGAMAGVGGQMGQAGNQYAQNATNGSIGAYMNPYISQSLAPQLQLLGQQTGINSAAQQGAATQAGAFGGSRSALSNALSQQTGQMAAQNAIAQGYNTAFGNAQQAQQFGANLGLQGQQAELGALNSYMGGANQLAGIGNQQLGAQQNILNTQNTMGAQQQNQQQNIINQAVQNYATAQQYPYMQLGQLNAMLRGLPMQQSSTSMYQAAPSTISQLGGLGIAGLGAAGMYNAATKASGGQVKSMADGGSAIPMKMMNDQQLNQIQQNPASTPMAKLNAQGIEQLHGYIHNNPMAGQMMHTPAAMPQGAMPPPQQIAQAPQDRNGVASIATPPDMTRMADGGIIAFAGKKSSVVKDDTAPAADTSTDTSAVDLSGSDIPRTKSGELDWASILAPRLAAEKSGNNTVTAAYAPLAKTQQEDIDQQKAMLIPEFATRLGLGMMNAPAGQPGSEVNQLLGNVGRSGLGAVQGLSSNVRDINAAKKQLGLGTIEAAKADQTRADALTQTLAQVYGTEQAKKVGLAQANATKQAGIDAKTAALIQAASTNYQTQVERVFKDLATQDKNALTFQYHPEELWKAAREQVYQTMPEVTRNLLSLAPPVAPKAAPDDNKAAPGAGVASVSQPVYVTIPAINGKPAQSFQFKDQTAANAFIATPQYQALVNPKK